MSRLLFIAIAALLAAPALIPHPGSQPWLPSGTAASHGEDLRAATASAEEEAFAEAVKLRRAGDLAEARLAGEAALAQFPFSQYGYRVMYDIARDADDMSDALRWAKWLTWSRRYTGKGGDPADLAELFDGQWEGWNRDAEILAAWDSSLRDAAKKAASRKQYRLAGHLMDRLLELNQDDSKLDKEYEKLADKAGQQLSGGAFVAASIRRKSADWLARENKEHMDWENPFERKTNNYNIFCNVSWEFTETLTAAMDQINEFYREVYDYKKKARATLHVMRRRSDFDKMTLQVTGRPMPSRGVGGFWLAGQKTVVAYDRSYDEEGFSQDALWNTLFHEASHQFMTLLSKERHIVPCWLNEGTATYFEGCEIKPDGSIVKNAPAVHRLRAWAAIDGSASRHSLEELIAHPRNTGADENNSLSYEGSFYPYGWALVYFLLNYEENDRRVYGTITPDGRIPEDYKAVRKAGRLVYRDAYAKYLEHFSKRGSNGDRYYALEVAKEYFVDDINDPDVQTWEDFEARWRKYCQSMYAEELSGAEFADVLQARSRGYLMSNDFERARITAEQADVKRPNDPETFLLLAESNAGEGRDADAVFWMVRHWEEMYSAGDDDAAMTAEAWLMKNGGKDVAELYLQPTRVAVDALGLAAQEALDDGEPMMAVLFAVHGCEVLGVDHPSLAKHFGQGTEAEESASALALTEKDLRMWQRAFDRGESSNRKFEAPGLTVDVLRYDPDGLFMNNPKGEGRPGAERVSRRSLENLQAPFEIRGAVQAEGRAVLNLGLDRSGRPQSSLIFEQDEDGPLVRTCEVRMQIDADGGRAFVSLNQVGGYSFPEGDKIEFHLQVAEGACTLAANGSRQAPLPEELPAKRMNGSISLDVHDDSVALWSNIEIRPSRPFWPVP